MQRSRIRFIIHLATIPILLGAALQSHAAQSEDSTWFVVSPIQGNRQLSYLLPLKDPSHIDHARQLIDLGPAAGGSIISAKIVAGTDGFNRNQLDPDQPLWSWHVDEVEGFGDFAIELCDGNPQLVEDDVEAWIANTQGNICFWNYTVSAELSQPPQFGIHSVSEGAWFNPETPGQGLFFDVVNGGSALFVGWFTFTLEDGPLGEPDPHWMTAFGPIVGSRAELDLASVRGGAFDSPEPVLPSPPGSVGTLIIELETCDSGTASYEFTNGLRGSFPIFPVDSADNCND